MTDLPPICRTLPPIRLNTAITNNTNNSQVEDVPSVPTAPIVNTNSTINTLDDFYEAYQIANVNIADTEIVMNNPNSNLEDLQKTKVALDHERTNLITLRSNIQQYRPTSPEESAQKAELLKDIDLLLVQIDADIQYNDARIQNLSTERDAQELAEENETGQIADFFFRSMLGLNNFDRITTMAEKSARNQEDLIRNITFSQSEDDRAGRAMATV